MSKQTQTATTPATPGPVVAAGTKIRKSKSERLVLKANVAVPKALRALSNVAALADLSPTQEQSQRILTVIQTQVEALTEAFAPKTQTEPASPTFTL